MAETFSPTSLNSDSAASKGHKMRHGYLSSPALPIHKQGGHSESGETGGPIYYHVLQRVLPGECINWARDFLIFFLTSCPI